MVKASAFSHNLTSFAQERVSPVSVQTGSGEYAGIYEVPEAARLLRATMPVGPYTKTVGSRKLIRWIRQGLASQDLVGIPGHDLLITFEDLISLRIVAALRAAGVSFARIRRAETWLRQQTASQRPFATDLLWTERSDVVVEFGEHLIAASREGQGALNFLRNYLIPIHGLQFDANHVAVAWSPTPGIRIDPQIQFGSPCVEGTRIPARNLWSMIKAGDTVQNVASWNGIHPEVVEIALDWQNAVGA
jgi:uncharacterized protein (DUF433 family)